MIEGLLLIIIAGLCWIGYGVTVSRCSILGLNFNVAQGVGFLGSFLICGLILTGSGAFAHPAEIFGWRFLSSCVAGVANFYTFVFASKAMKQGPNGLVWGIMQSGMIGSFLMGVFFFGEEPAPVRLIGLALIVSGVLTMGLAKGSKASDQGNRWVFLSFCAFFLVMTTNCCNTLPSFFPETAKISSISRGFGLFLGGSIGFAITSLPGMIRRRDFGGRGEWIAGLILVLLQTSSNAVFFFRGLDLLARNGRGGLGYPIGIGICVIGFSLYSWLILKERTTRLASAGLAAVCIGVVIISIR